LNERAERGQQRAYLDRWHPSQRSGELSLAEHFALAVEDGLTVRS
jgi:hypothetical protein